MAITRLSGGLTPADGSDPRTFPAIWNDAAGQIETAQSDIDAVEADVLEAQGDISTLQSGVATNQSNISTTQSNLSTTQSDLDALEAIAITLASGTPVDGDSIVYDTGSGGWIPGAGGGGASLTVSDTAPSSPSLGDLWFDSTDGRTYVYYTDADGSQWVEVGAAASGNVANGAIQLNYNEISTSYSFPAGYNGVSAGPITIASGATVTVPSGSAWSIV